MAEGSSNKKVQVEPEKTFRPPEEGDIIEYGGHEYRFGKFIDSGAFGLVYECADEWDNELVAKVFMPKNQTYLEVQKLWSRELNALRELRHPNVTFIHDAFECNDTFYLIIERCALTIKDLIQRQQQLPNLSGEIWIPHVARDVLQALHYIHESGYVHKDVHPGNVFVSLMNDKMFPGQNPVMRFKVGDLGISNLESQIFPLNTFMANWMLPPEYLKPDSFGVLDRRVDVYHVGLLFLSILSKQELVFTVDDVLEGKPRQLAEKLESPYGPVIAKALRRHVDARTATAAEFWKEIKACAE
ncbi:protein kinase family protein [Archangium sp.]|uniref:serine/threonine protein kinase n=1 Tax=Archangium sp. TaxID=1872627 RepID=UPI002D624FAA|nr:protein kinase family protein [Archangium sp.]HYO59005.1 protein kinase family protein [Archangium sp.]